MTDIELINLASKASGFEYTNNDNPLMSDALALRLAVKLNMGISIPVFKEPRVDVITFRNSLVNVIEKGDDLYAATRRCITRAAAEIGKGMP